MSLEPNSLPDDATPPHLASAEAFARWCAENPEGVRQMEMTARRMELGEFGDLPPKTQANVRRFLEVRREMREADAHNAAVLAELRRVRETLTNYQGTLPVGHLAAQLAELEARIGRREPITEAWEQFRLDYEAFQGELMGSLWKRTAMIAMSADAQERRNPGKFAHDANAQELIRAWRSGERERLLGRLPIADRRELEALEREWREHPPGSGQ